VYHSSFLSSLDTGDIAALALLDLSAAFDTVDHTILLQRLQTSFGLNGTVLSWFCSYLDQRRQHVRYRGEQSATSEVQFGVPQGSVLGPLLFVLYTADIVNIIAHQGLSAHQYADDIQVYGRCRPNVATSLSLELGSCIEQVADWMGVNRLQLNAAKTEFMWFVPPRRRHQLPSDHLAVGPVQVKPATSVRDLGVYLDSDLSMRSHITRLVCTCFGVLRQIRSIRRSLPRESVLTLISSLVMSKLDYCNVAFAGLPRCELDRMQSAINAAARLTVGAHLHDHITPLLADLHWLRIPQRIQYKLCVLVFNCVHGSAPRYLQEVIRPVESIEPRRRLRSASSADLLVPATRHSTLGDRAFAVAGPRAWNSLPDAIRRCSSPDNFKRALKTHLYIQSYF